jgi:hypothetical protein
MIFNVSGAINVTSKSPGALQGLKSFHGIGDWSFGVLHVSPDMLEELPKLPRGLYVEVDYSVFTVFTVLV